MTISFKVSENTKEKLIDFFQDAKREKTPPYAVFQADSEDTVVTLYESGKVVFQGVSADIDANMWKEMEKHLNPNVKIDETKEKKQEDKIDKNIYYSNSIGSDEVGTGDYFGPIVVTACFVKKEDISFLEDLGVKDSKMLNDDKILKVVPEIIKKIKYESIILKNKEYNEKYKENFNMNKIKAILHNKVLFKIKNEVVSYDHIIIDQFAEKYVYYNYLKETEHVVKNITFLTKAESKVLSVACASLISRYIFIKEFSKISEELGILIPKGAGNLVDQAALKVIEKHGFEKLENYVKLNFKNTNKIKELI